MNRCYVRDVAAELARIESIDELVIMGGRYDILSEVPVPTPKASSASSMIRSVEGIGNLETLTYLDFAKQTCNWGTR